MSKEGHSTISGSGDFKAVFASSYINIMDHYFLSFGFIVQYIYKPVDFYNMFVDDYYEGKLEQMTSERVEQVEK